MIQTNCPNCGAPIEPYKYRCDYCGTYYLDLTAFDMSENKPYYVKFGIPGGTITTRAIPEVKNVDVYEDSFNALDCMGNAVATFVNSRSCDIGVIFHSVVSPEDNTLYKVEINN